MSFPRYPAYKDSGFEAVPKIPERWVPIRLRFLLRDGYDGIKIGPFGSQLTSDMLDDAGDYKVYGQEHVIANDFDRGSRYIDRAKFEELTAYEIKSGDLLVTMMGTSGRCDVVPSKIVPGVMDSHLLRIRVAPSVKPEFVRLLIDQSAYVGTQIDLAGKGSIMHGLNSTIVKNLLLFVPPVDEQAQILTFLDHETAKIDALVAEQERLIELLKEKRQAVISHAVTKGLDPSVPMKNSGVEWLGEVPVHWDVSPLKYLARIGNGSTPNRDNPDYWAEEGFPWLNSSVVNHSEVSEAERFVTNAALKECHLPIIEPPAVLIGITGQGKTRGMAAPLTFTATVNQHLAYVKPDQERLGVDFLLRALEAAYEHLRTESEGVGSTKGAITCGQLGAWFMPVPDIPEQAKIVAFLTGELGKLDALTEEAERGIAYLQERRTALISAAVTGQIDVRGRVPAEAVA